MKKEKCSNCRYYNDPNIFNKSTNYCKYSDKYMILDVACPAYERPMSFIKKVILNIKNLY